MPIGKIKVINTSVVDFQAFINAQIQAKAGKRPSGTVSKNQKENEKERTSHKGTR